MFPLCVTHCRGPSAQRGAHWRTGPRRVRWVCAVLETLETYLDSGRSPTETAARLGLHRSTVAQRIRRAEKELSVSLEDPDQCLAIHLASRVLRLS